MRGDSVKNDKQSVFVGNGRIQRLKQPMIDEREYICMRRSRIPDQTVDVRDYSKRNTCELEQVKRKKSFTK